MEEKIYAFDFCKIVKLTFAQCLGKFGFFCIPRSYSQAESTSYFCGIISFAMFLRPWLIPFLDPFSCRCCAFA